MRRPRTGPPLIIAMWLVCLLGRALVGGRGGAARTVVTRSRGWLRGFLWGLRGCRRCCVGAWCSRSARCSLRTGDRDCRGSFLFASDDRGAQQECDTDQRRCSAYLSSNHYFTLIW